jgi:hypothetical protein
MFSFFRFSDNCRCKGDALWLGWRETQADDLASPGEAVLMPTTSESPAPVSGTSQKTLQLLRKRLRQLRRVTLALVIGLAIAATGLAIWWLNSLNGLPDIGDPFDVAAFGALSIPDDQNAFALLRRAQQMLTLPPLNVDMRDPRLREWVKASRPAVELFLKAAECPDAMSEPPDAPPNFIYGGLTILPTPTGSTYEYPIERVSPGNLIGLTILEGERRSASGDPAGAWDCYRAVLRMMDHMQRRARFGDRHRANLHHSGSILRHAIETWAADPRTTIPQLRRALDVMVECRPRIDWDAYSLKREYLDLMRFLDGPVDPDLEQIEHDLTYRMGEYKLPIELSVRLHHAKRRLWREPERSRRVVRLLFANWLAQAEPGDQTPRQPAVRARFRAAGHTTAILLYPVGPEAPAGARALAPHEVARWLVTTTDARYTLRYGSYLSPFSLRQRERRAHRQLLVLLASELFRRERGAPPPNDEALVGTYLESLPDDGSSDLADERTLTVE